MYPTLSHAIKDLTGFDVPFPIATFGFFMALSFFVSSRFLIAELKRKEKDGLMHSYIDEKGNEIHPHQMVSTMILIAIGTGIIGARLFSILEYPSAFLEAPIKTLISSSGLTFYGGLILGASCVILYTRKKKIKTIHLLDAAAPALMLSYAIGRIGCHLSGDGDWGIVNTAVKPHWMNFLPDWIWAYDYPHNVAKQGVLFDSIDAYGYVLPQPVFPTPLYEAIMCFMLFTILWAIRKKIAAPGLLFATYLIFNGVERFLIEKIRVDSEYNFLGFQFKQATLISVILFCVGALIIATHFKNKRNRLEDEFTKP